MAVSVPYLFLAMPWVCLQCVIVAFPGHTHLILYHPLYISVKEYAIGKIIGLTVP